MYNMLSEMMVQRTIERAKIKGCVIDNGMAWNYSCSVTSTAFSTIFVDKAT